MRNFYCIIFYCIYVGSKIKLLSKFVNDLQVCSRNAEERAQQT